jgi:hypothetical protein
VVTTSLPINTTNFAAGSVWDLIDWTTAFSGTFSNLTSTLGNFAGLPDLSGINLRWDVSSIYTTGQIAVAYVPEPQRLGMLFMGLLCLLARRRRNRW